jgi:hypothetical protein
MRISEFHILGNDQWAGGLISALWTHWGLDIDV